MTDVVYYVRNGKRNEELRYSLRSLANLPHERVYIVGYTPPWVAGVTSIPGNLVHTGPQYTAVDNLLRACDAVDAERFVIFNDDFYVTEPIEAVPSWHAGPLAQKAATTHSGYGYAIKEALRQLNEMGHADPVAWTLHIPVLVVRKALATVLGGLIPRGRVLPEWRTMYGNLTSQSGEQHADVKVRRRSESVPQGPLLSSLDGAFYRVLPTLRSLFPEPCAYEVAP